MGGADPLLPPLCVQESTLKSVLSALWNLSAHSTENKAAICQVDGALGFLVSTLTYKCQSNSLAIIESGGGILRNVSSLIATREDYRSAPPRSRQPGARGGGGARALRGGGRRGAVRGWEGRAHSAANREQALLCAENGPSRLVPRD